MINETDKKQGLMKQMGNRDTAALIRETNSHLRALEHSCQIQIMK